MPAHRFTFYIPSLSSDAHELEIGGDEHHHLARVLRLGVGEVIAATNGRGLLVEGEIVSTGKARSTARVARLVEDAAPSRRIVLALSLLPRAHFEQAIAQCVEVGVTGIVPVIAEKCHVKRIDMARAKRVAVAAMKQSGRAWLPTIENPRTVDTLAREVEAGEYGTAFVGDQGGSSMPPAVADPVIVLVGPEAGFSTREMERLENARALRVRVSTHRLRAETAAVVMVSSLAHSV
jgi:16S rRNA (uracil1498-N3)-methyltransferase